MQDVTVATELDFGRAYAEASRCLLCHNALLEGLPGGDRPGHVHSQAQARNVKGAIRHHQAEQHPGWCVRRPVPHGAAL